MDQHTLTTALRLGSEREYSEEDLGKFGLGLKTASMSQCRRLTVASRTDPARARIGVRCWDLEHINKTDAWELLTLSPRECRREIIQPLRNAPGTVVFWQRLDRMLGYQHPYGEHARKGLLSMCRELEQHLAMVFHRFLDGEVAGQPLTILLNGNRVVPWDPFARSEKHTRTLPQVDLPFTHEGAKGSITLRPYVLPNQGKFSTVQAASDASGPKKWNRQQGFYIYRANRLIQSGGWSNLRTLDEHTKLARIALEFSPRLDSAFKVNVAKMRAQLPQELRESVKQALGPVVRAAQLEYRQKDSVRRAKSLSAGISSSSPLDTANKSPTSTSNGHRPSLKSVSEDRGSGANGLYSASRRTKSDWSLEELRERLLCVAQPEEQALVERLFERLVEELAGEALPR